MDFFNSCKDKEEAKKVYRQLCKHFHPDKGGEPALMLQLQDQYDKFFKTKETVYKQSAYGASQSFQFNTVNKNINNIPFDHPLNIEVNKLRNQLKIVNCELDIIKINFVNLSDKVTILKKENESTLESFKFERGKNIMLSNLNEIIKLKITDFEKMTVFEFIKYKWRKSSIFRK